MTPNDWIPVGERLPEGKATVVAMDRLGAHHLCWHDDDTRGAWLDCWGEGLPDITHWMPLPPPPEESGSGLWIVQLEGGDGHWFTVTEFGLRSDGMTREQAEKVAASLRGSTVRIVPADGSPEEPDDAN